MSRLQRLLDFGRRLISRAVPSGGVAERTIKSGMWLTAMKYSDRALQLLMMVILARILSPRDFGLLGIALLTLGALKRFSQLGLEAALIQQEEENVDEYLNTAWCLEIARGVLLASICFLFAPYIASFFGEPRATNPIRAIGLVSLFHGLRNPGIVYFQKDLKFHKEFIYRMSGSVANFTVALVIAIIYASVWALILGYVAGRIARMVSSYLIHEYRPWPNLNFSYMKELISYGKWITGTHILYYLYDKGDDVIVGWVLTASSLGLYQIAYELANAPATEITHILRQVMFPAFSQLQNDMAALRQAYFRMLQVTMLLTFPAAVGILLITPHFVEIVLGPDWLPMVVTMQLFAIYGLIRAYTAGNGAVWRALDRPDYGTKLSGIRVVIMAITIYPATLWFGIEGAAFVVVVHSLVPIVPLNIYIIANLTETSYYRFARETAYPLVATGLMAVAVVSVERFMSIQSIYIEFVILVVTGVGAYVIAVVLLEKQFNWGIEQNLRSAIQTAKG